MSKGGQITLKAQKRRRKLFGKKEVKIHSEYHKQQHQKLKSTVA